MAVAKFIVAISFGKGIICCEQYYDQMTGPLFKTFINDHFDNIFSRSVNPRGKRFLQDGDPCQNSRICKEAMEKLGASLFPIPARSPDINPIENVFNNVKVQLREDAIINNITRESFDAFCERVKRTVENFDTEIIDKTILSMDKRRNLILKGRGERLKY